MKKYHVAGVLLGVFLVFSFVTWADAADLQGVWEGTISCLYNDLRALDKPDETQKTKNSIELSIVKNTSSQYPEYYVFMENANFSLNTGESRTDPGTGEGIFVNCRDVEKAFESGNIDIVKMEYDIAHGTKDTMDGIKIITYPSDGYWSGQCRINVTRVSTVPKWGQFIDCASIPEPYTP